MCGNNYKHAQNARSTFGFQTLAEYSDMELKMDVLLLTEVFEKFCETWMQTMVWMRLIISRRRNLTLTPYSRNTEVEL